MAYQYYRWDGTQEIGPFDPDALMDALADDLLADGDLQSALEQMLRWGAEGDLQDRIPGLERLLEQLRARRQQELERYNLDSLMDDLRQRLDQVVKTERGGIDRRLEEARAQS